jgi:hypothetical protein
MNFAPNTTLGLRITITIFTLPSLFCVTTVLYNKTTYGVENAAAAAAAGATSTNLHIIEKTINYNIANTSPGSTVTNNNNNSTNFK